MGKHTENGAARELREAETTQPGFTPGPLEVRTDCGLSFYIAEKGKLPHANVFGRTEQWPETTRADADLYAAAPDLYAACKKLLAFAHSVRPGGGVLAGEQEMFAAARLALSRVKGGA